jgi:hypothetical protein
VVRFRQTIFVYAEFVMGDLSLSLCQCRAHCGLFLPKFVCAKSENYHPNDITRTVFIQVNLFREVSFIQLGMWAVLKASAASKVAASVGWRRCNITGRTGNVRTFYTRIARGR